MPGDSAVEGDGSRPQRIIGTGYEYFIARIQQGTKRQVDQFADPVAGKMPFWWL